MAMAMAQGGKSSSSLALHVMRSHGDETRDGDGEENGEVVVANGAGSADRAVEDGVGDASEQNGGRDGHENTTNDEQEMKEKEMERKKQEDEEEEEEEKEKDKETIAGFGNGKKMARKKVVEEPSAASILDNFDF